VGRHIGKKQTYTQTRQTDRSADIRANRQADRQTDRSADIRAGRQTDRQVSRH